MEKDEGREKKEVILPELELVDQSQNQQRQNWHPLQFLCRWDWDPNMVAATLLDLNMKLQHASSRDHFWKMHTPWLCISYMTVKNLACKESEERSWYTNKISSKLPIGEPSGGNLVKKISTIWEKIASESRVYEVVVSRVYCGVSKHVQGWDLLLGSFNFGHKTWQEKQEKLREKGVWGLHSYVG